MQAAVTSWIRPLMSPVSYGLQQANGLPKSASSIGRNIQPRNVQDSMFFSERWGSAKIRI